MNTIIARKPKTNRRTAEKTQVVHFEFTASEAEGVGIAGTFNDWRPEATPMFAVADGRWVKELALSPGTYEYCFVVDGVWRTDPQAGETVPNPFGGLNAVLRVAAPGGSGAVLPTPS